MTVPRRKRSSALLFAARAVLVGAVLLGLSLSASACGSGSATPSVASLGSTTTSLASGGASAGGAALNYADAVKYAQCMRTHGVPNMPDPDSKGNFLYNHGLLNGVPNVYPNSSAYQKADKTCSHLLPNGGQLTPAEREQAIARLLKFVQCLRTHGVPTMPDPIVSGGNIAMMPPRGIGPNSPVFQRAQKACASLSPAAGA